MSRPAVSDSAWSEVLEEYGELLSLDAPSRETALEDLARRKPEIAPHVRQLFDDARLMQASGFMSGDARASWLAEAAGDQPERSGAAFGNYRLDRLQIGRAHV